MLLCPIQVSLSVLEISGDVARSAEPQEGTCQQGGYPDYLGLQTLGHSLQNRPD